jgi:hypothetical protein
MNSYKLFSAGKMIIPSFYDVKFIALTQLSTDSFTRIKITTFDPNDLHRLKAVTIYLHHLIESCNGN